MCGCAKAGCWPLCRFHLQVPTTDVAISLVLGLRCRPERHRLILADLFHQEQLYLCSTRSPFCCCKKTPKVMPPVQHVLRQSHRKSTRGCQTCKRRHVKCDELQPNWQVDAAGKRGMRKLAQLMPLVVKNASAAGGNAYILSAAVTQRAQAPTQPWRGPISFNRLAMSGSARANRRSRV